MRKALAVIIVATIALVSGWVGTTTVDTSTVGQAQGQVTLACQEDEAIVTFGGATTCVHRELLPAGG
jgi:hypothetical protein